MTLDDVDTRLLTALQNDTYLTAQELGGTLNFSVLNRLLHQVLPGHPGVARLQGQIVRENVRQVAPLPTWSIGCRTPGTC
ncbi:MAG: hypothetical protein KDE03_13275 [Rhodobacteraceae bacterium]|nr:hypothetical protein [Paracoccaceae bacterium]